MIGATSPWSVARQALAGLPGGGLNIAHEAVDRHAAGAIAHKVAVRCISRRDSVTDLSYGELARLSARFANALAALGVRRGEVVALVLGRIPALYLAALGTLKTGAVLCPLFSAFGPEPLRARLTIGAARVLVTTASLYAKRIAPIRPLLPALEHVFIVRDTSSPLPDRTHDFFAALDTAADTFVIPPTTAEDPALLHFTSGTTGTPKGAVHVHDAVTMHRETARVALDLRAHDTFWCTADPGWVTGTSYGIVGPLTLGVTSIVDEAEFDAERWYRLIERERVTVWYTAPTAIRMLMRLGTEGCRRFALKSLRFLASVGEPLNPEAVVWGSDAFGSPFHDNWWQTETGGIMIANCATTPVRPGSMGLPLPGVEAAIVQRDGDRVAIIDEPDTTGELALRPGWPSMFRSYLHDEERYRHCFVGGFYLSGDLARRDRDGYYWFVGRGDDVIKSAGHLIGPFEVESALLEHDAVAEAGVIGLPDPVCYEVVKAFVSLKPGCVDTEDLRLDLMAFARTKLGAAVAPRAIVIVPSLPRTRSGKIMRRLLKARDLGLPEGDTSTLEA